MDFLNLPELSLLRMSLIRTASCLWLSGEPDIADQDVVKTDDLWRYKEEQVASSLNKMTLPESVKKQLSFIVMPIGRELRNWFRKMSHGGMVRPSLMRARMSTLPWSADATIDEELVSSSLVRDQELSIAEQFRVACEFCLEDEIRSLWPLVKDTYNEKPNSKAQRFWTSHLEGQIYCSYESFRTSVVNELNPMSLYAFLFSYELVNNQVTRKYLWSKLTESERQEKIESWIVESPQYEETAAKFLRFIYNEMNPEQRERFQSKFPSTSLGCFMTWPNYKLFLSMVIHKPHADNDYFIILDTLVKTAKRNPNDVSYRLLFQQCWKGVDLAIRLAFLKKSHFIDLIVNQLIEAELKDYVKLILNDLRLMDEESRGQVVLGINGLHLILKFTSEPELMELLLDICVTNKTITTQILEDANYLDQDEFDDIIQTCFPYIMDYLLC